MNGYTADSQEIKQILQIFDQPSIAINSNQTLLNSIHEIANYYHYPNGQQTTPPSADNLSLKQLTRFYGLRYQYIQLNDEWWKQDSGALLIEVHEKIYVIIPENSSYRLYDPEIQQWRKCSEKILASLPIHKAYAFYPQLPDTALNWRNLLSFFISYQKREVINSLFLQILISLLGLLIPVMTGLLIDHVIPNADKKLWLELTLLLIGSTIAIGAFSLAQYISLIRIQLHMSVKLQTAIWDRILRMPLRFFNQYVAGDLANRISGIDRIQQELTQNVLVTLLSGFISLFTLAVMLLYSPLLTLVAVLITVVIILFTALAMLVQLNWQRLSEKYRGELSAWLLQCLLAINKLRAANAEKTAVQRWLSTFTKMASLFSRIGKWHFNIDIITGLLYLMATAIIYTVMVKLHTTLSLGNFISFNAAFTMFTNSLLALLEVFTTLINVVPLYERLKPILATGPVTYKHSIKPLSLKGQLTVNHLSFGYSENNPLVLQDISLNVEPGQRVAIVGASGSGKSTLLRLLLGLDKPASGHIYIDGIDLQNLDGEAWRHAVGVVLQQHNLFPGSIFENIAGENEPDEEDIWQLLKFVGMHDEVAVMPMNLQTFVGENGTSLSLGQCQRLLLARALLKKPKILFLDEATSALDNISQRIITENLTAAKITQIIIAHRLSTLTAVDYVYVLDQGKIVDAGNITTLLSKENSYLAQAWQREMY